MTTSDDLDRIEQSHNGPADHKDWQSQDITSNRRQMIQTILIPILLVIVALVSAIPVANWASSPSTYTDQIQKLDTKADNVMALTATTAAFSAGISAIPGDMGTPIANKLVDLTSDFLVILVAIFLEKYLLTILGLAAFRVIIPAGLVLLAASLITVFKPKNRASCLQFGLRLLVFGVLTFALIPVSIYIADMIDSTYAADTEQSTLSQLTATTQEDESATTDSQDATTTDESQSDDPWSQFSTWVSNLGTAAADTVSDVASTISTDASALAEQTKNILSDLIEQLAVMIVTSCIIPILTLLFFLWAINTVFKLNISLPTEKFISERNKLHQSTKVVSPADE